MSNESGHRHEWQSLGFYNDGLTFVVQSCRCGDAREVEARRVYGTNEEHPMQQPQTNGPER